MQTINRVNSTAGLLACALAFSPVGHAGEPTLEQVSKEVEALKQGQQLIQKQLQEIKALVSSSRTAAKRPPPVRDLKDVVLAIEGEPIKGADEAKLVIVEFSDYQCPYCARHTQKVLPKLQQEYVAAGKVRYVFKDFPLERIHGEAALAAQAANCAGEQGKYWEMHDRLFANRKDIEPLNPHAESVGVDLTAFEACVDSGKYVEEVQEDLAEGREVGIRSTPTFILGMLAADGKTVNGKRLLRGALPFNRFKDELDKLLASMN